LYYRLTTYLKKFMKLTAANKNDPVEVVIKGMTREQAHAFCSWYEGQGEQDQGIWFDDLGVNAPTTDVGRKGGFLTEVGSTLTMHVK
jgi:hypothetical protein